MFDNFSIQALPYQICISFRCYNESEWTNSYKKWSTWSTFEIVWTMQLKRTPFHNIVTFIVYRGHDKRRAFIMQALVTGNLIIIWLALFYRSAHCCLITRNWMKVHVRPHASFLLPGRFDVTQCHKSTMYLNPWISIHQCFITESQNYCFDMIPFCILLSIEHVSMDSISHYLHWQFSLNRLASYYLSVETNLWISVYI